MAGRPGEGVDLMAAGDNAGITSRLRVLVVDDDDLVRGVIAETLEAIGCQVVAARDAQEAVSTFLTGEFDLVTLDNRMPGLSGMELHKLLSQEFGAGKRTTGFTPKRLCPVVIVTGYAEDPEVVHGQFGESIVGIVAKPLAHEGLCRIVRELAEKRPADPGSGKTEVGVTASAAAVPTQGESL